MKLHIKSTQPPMLVLSPDRAKTMVFGGNITEVNGEEWGYPHITVVSDEIISLEDIEWEKIPSHDDGRTFYIQGSTGNIYKVERDGSGNYTCECPDHIHRQRVCKHIREAIDQYLVSHMVG